MNRLFSIRRRRPHLVDFWTPRVAGVDGYRLKWSANFAGSAVTTIITSTNVGFIDDNVNRNVVETQPLDGWVRVVFDPTTYSIPDGLSFWLQFVPVTGGIEGTPGAMTLVLPDPQRYGIVTIAGTAPGAPGQQLDLPGLVRDIRITSGGTLLVSTEEGGPQTTITAANGPQQFSMSGTQGSLYVQGAAFTATFTSATTQAFPR